jgi:hypothetical protein
MVEWLNRQIGEEVKGIKSAIVAIFKPGLTRGPDSVISAILMFGSIGYIKYLKSRKETA